jgi:hypothetical protein
MNNFRRIRELLALPLILSLLLSTFPVTATSAENIGTDQLIEDSVRLAERAQVLAFVSRGDIREQMSTLGVDPNEALERISSFSDDEIRQIAGQLDTLPAGGDALGTIVGAALTVFVILLITDLLCLTSFFNFTRCVT